MSGAEWARPGTAAGSPSGSELFSPAPRAEATHGAPGPPTADRPSGPSPIASGSPADDSVPTPPHGHPAPGSGPSTSAGDGADPTAWTVALPVPTGGPPRRGRRTSLAVRITAACLLVAVVAVGAAGLVATRLVAVTARSVTQDVLAQQADVVAAQLADTGGGLRGSVGIRRVVDVLQGQGVTVVAVTARGTIPGAGPLAPVLNQADVKRVLTGQGVSTTVLTRGVRYLVEARPAPVGGFALVRTTDAGPLGSGLVGRNLAVALLVGIGVAVVVGVLVGQLLARPLRRTATAARTLRSGRRDVRIPVAGPVEVSDVAGAVNELADALARSEQRQRAFLLSVSHELRTPLTAVRGFAESLADGVVTGDDAAGAGQVIVREADRLDRLVSDLMELARLQADDFRLDPVPVDLAALADDASTVWAARCAEAGVRLVLEASPTGTVRADPRRLRQVVDGLAENALRVTPRDAALVLATGGDASTSWLQVRDGGPGLAPEDYPVVFERGVLHDRYRGRRPVGSGGVGLALVQGLVMRMGATISAAPAPEGGACFTVAFPVRRPPGSG